MSHDEIPNARRYTHAHHRNGTLRPHDEGEWVTYTEHIKAVEAAYWTGFHAGAWLAKHDSAKAQA